MAGREGYHGVSVQADTWLMDSIDKKSHPSAFLLPPPPPPWSRGEDDQPWGHTGLPESSPASTRGIRQRWGSVPLPEGRRAVEAPLLSRAPGRPKRLFPLKRVTCRATGEDLAGRHFCSAAGLITRGLASLPPAHGSPSPPRSPLNGSPAGKPRQSPVPPSPTSLSPGDASFPPPHLSLLFLANSPPPPGSSRSHNSILFMETNCPAGGCT